MVGLASWVSDDDFFAPVGQLVDQFVAWIISWEHFVGQTWTLTNWILDQRSNYSVKYIVHALYILRNFCWLAIDILCSWCIYQIVTMYYLYFILKFTGIHSWTYLKFICTVIYCGIDLDPLIKSWGLVMG